MLEVESRIRRFRIQIKTVSECDFRQIPILKDLRSKIIAQSQKYALRDFSDSNKYFPSKKEEKLFEDFLNGLGSIHSPSNYQIWSVQIIALLENQIRDYENFEETEFPIEKPNYEPMSIESSESRIRDKIFVSHSSDDEELCSVFCEKILKVALRISDEHIIYTSHPTTSLGSGEWAKNLQDGIKKAKIAIFFVTDHFKNSQTCLIEFGAFWARNEDKRELIPLTYDLDSLGPILSNFNGRCLTRPGDIDWVINAVLDSSPDICQGKGGTEYVNDFVKAAEDYFSKNASHIPRLKRANNNSLPEFTTIAFKAQFYIFRKGIIRKLRFGRQMRYFLNPNNHLNCSEEQFDDFEKGPDYPTLDQCVFIIDESSQTWLIVGDEIRKFPDDETYTSLIMKSKQNRRGALTREWFQIQEIEIGPEILSIKK